MRGGGSKDRQLGVSKYGEVEKKKCELQVVSISLTTWLPPDVSPHVKGIV
jgi:hypothetical protein